MSKIKKTSTPATATAKNKKTKIQVIARAVSVLRSLEHEPEGLSLGAIAQRLKLPRSTIQRIVGALEAEHLLIAASPTGRVKLGPALLRLSASVEISASAIVKPYMLELAREFGETVVLTAMGRDHAIFIDQAIGSRLYAISAIAEKFPLFCTAAGKAMLAQMTDAEIDAKFGRTYEARTDYTRTNLSALLADIHETRRTGLAHVLQEHTLGVCALAIGFRDSLGNKMAISMPIPNSRFPEFRSSAGKRLLALRAQLNARFNPK